MHKLLWWNSTIVTNMLNGIEGLIEGDRLDPVSKGGYRNNSWVRVHIPIWGQIHWWRAAKGRYRRQGRPYRRMSELLSNHVVRECLCFCCCSTFARILCLLDTI